METATIEVDKEHETTSMMFSIIDYGDKLSIIENNAGAFSCIVGHTLVFYFVCFLNILIAFCLIGIGFFYNYFILEIMKNWIIVQ
jgi:hypothetical protein